MTQLAKDVASSVREETDFDLLTTIGCADIDQGHPGDFVTMSLGALVRRAGGKFVGGLTA